MSFAKQKKMKIQLFISLRSRISFQIHFLSLTLSTRHQTNDICPGLVEHAYQCLMRTNTHGGQWTDLIASQRRSTQSMFETTISHNGTSSFFRMFSKCVVFVCVCAHETQIRMLNQTCANIVCLVLCIIVR